MWHTTHMRLQKIIANVGIYVVKMYPDSVVSYHDEVIIISFESCTVEISFRLLDKTVKNISLDLVEKERKRRDLERQNDDT